MVARGFPASISSARSGRHHGRPRNRRLWFLDTHPDRRPDESSMRTRPRSGRRSANERGRRLAPARRPQHRRLTLAAPPPCARVVSRESTGPISDPRHSPGSSVPRETGRLSPTDTEPHPFADWTAYPGMPEGPTDLFHVNQLGRIISSRRPVPRRPTRRPCST